MFMTSTPFYAVRDYRTPWHHGPNRSTRCSAHHHWHPYAHTPAPSFVHGFFNNSYEDLQAHAFHHEMQRQQAWRARRNAQRRQAQKAAEERRRREAEAEAESEAFEVLLALQHQEQEQEQQQEQEQELEGVKILEHLFGITNESDSEEDEEQEEEEDVDMSSESEDSDEEENAEQVTLTLIPNVDDDEQSDSSTDDEEEDNEPLVEEPHSDSDKDHTLSRNNGETIELDAQEVSADASLSPLEDLQQQVSRVVETIDRVGSDDSEEDLPTDSKAAVLEQSQSQLESLYQTLEDFEASDRPAKRTLQKVTGQVVTYIEKVEALLKEQQQEGEEKVKEETASTTSSQPSSPQKVRHVVIETIPDDSE